MDCSLKAEETNTGCQAMKQRFVAMTVLKRVPNWEPTRVADSDEPVLREELLRKEVIQPHLPVRLPCYDFTPIANPTFGSSLP